MGQVQEALAHANSVRVERAMYRKSVRDLPWKDGRVRLADILEENPECIGSIRIEDLLGWVKRVGPFTAQPLMDDADCTPFTTVRDMGLRRRALLIEALRYGVWRQAA